MRKILTILLSVVMLVTSVSVGFVVSATEGNANVDDVLELSTSETPTLSSKNRLSGVPMYTSSAPNATATAKPTENTNNNSSNFLYDGVLQVTDSSSRSGYRYYNGLIREGNSTSDQVPITGESKAKFVLNMGKIYNIDSFLVAGSSNNHPITSFEIYVGDDMDTLFNAENKIVAYERTDNTKYMYHIKLKETVSFNYYGIKILAVDKDAGVLTTHSTDSAIYLNEFGAYGAATTTATTQTQLSETSITYGSTPQITNNKFASVSKLADSNYSAKDWSNGKVSEYVYNYRIGDAAGGMRITYDLKNSYNVSKVLLASGASDKVFVNHWQVYASNSLDDLYNAKNLYFDADIDNTTQKQKVLALAELSKSVTCQYVGIQILENSDGTKTSYILEIGVYGTSAFTNESNLEISAMPGDNVINKAATAGTVKTYLRQGIATDYGKWNDRTTSGCHSSSGSVDVLYNNSLSKTDRKVVNTVSADANGFYNMSIVFETSTEYTVNAALLALNKTNMGTNTVSYIAYVGDTKETLFSPENVLAVSDNPNNLHSVYVSVPAEKAKTGKVFGIMIKGSTTKTTLYPDEVAFFEPNAAYGENITSADGINMLDGNATKFYKYSFGTGEFTERTADENSQNVNKLTNGSFTDESNKNSFRSTGLRFYSATATAIVVDAGSSIDISKVLLASGVSLDETNDTAFGAYSVYVGDTLDATLFNDENRVAYYANCNFSQIQNFDLSSANISGRFVALRIHDIYTHYTSSGLSSGTADAALYITEFAVYGNWSTDAYTVVNEPKENDIAANELQYATLSEATDTDNILTDGKVYYTGAQTGAAVHTVEDTDNVTFTYDLDATVSINSFLIGSKYDVNTNLTPAHYKIYVADTEAALDSATALVDYYPASYVQNSGTYQGSVQQFVLKDAVQGRYVRFEFTKAALSNGDLNLTELGVYTNAEAVIDLTGSITAPTAVYTDGETAEFNTDSNQLKLDSTMARGQHSVVVADASGNTEVYFLNKGAATKQDALANAFTNKSATFADSTPYGIDFVVEVTDTAKAAADEIGIVIAKSQTLKGADLIADSEDYKNAKAVAYDGTVDYIDGNSFSATVHNFEQYKYLYRYAARAYMIVDGYVVYGVTFDTTPAEAAQKIVDNTSGYSEELVAYAQNIVDNSGLSEVALARADFLRLESVNTDGLDAAATLANSVACNETVNLARLKGVIEKAQRGEDIVLATLGGSITQGFNANYNPATGKSELDRSTHCWSNLLREWLQNTFNVNVTLYNAGIGSTTSIVGVGRVVNDVLSHNPDLVVIDFAVNDSYSGTAACHTMTQAYEALTRRILNADYDNDGTKDAALMMLFNVKENHTNKQEEYSAIGNHYGVPMISYRDAIVPLLTDATDGGTSTYVWDDFSNDTIHPHAYGHQVIAALFGHYLAGVIEDVDNITDTVTTPSDYFNTETAADVQSFETATLYHSDTLPAEWVESYGCFEVSHNIHNQFPNGWLADYTVDSSNAPMVINVPKASKILFLVHDKKNNGSAFYANAVLDFEGASSVTGVNMPTNGNNDMANATLKYNSTTSGTVKITITPQTSSTLTQFKLLGIIVCE